MIDFLRGTLASKKQNFAVLDVSGVGYGVSITVDTYNKLPKEGNEIKLYIVESASMYGGTVSHYGFISREERDMFMLLKDEVPSTGAKKAMDYLEKISKSFADFKTAVIRRDTAMISGIFGFTKKTAEKLIAALKDKITEVNVSAGQKRFENAASSNMNEIEAVEGLVALGYKEIQARTAVDKVVGENSSAGNFSSADIIKEALKYL